MPRRLAVVVSQNPSGSLTCRNLEEALITALIMEAGLDVSVVPHVGDLANDHTGLLCLEGIQGPMVLVSWLPPPEAQRALAERGLSARLGRTTFFAADSNGDSEATRVVYAMDFSSFSHPDPIRAEICRIRDDLATPTISVIAPLPPVGQAPAAEQAPPARPAPAATAPASERSSDDDPALDQLVDLLDNMDL